MASVAFKELNELLDGALLGVKDFQELMADGKIDFRDVAVLIKISQQLHVFNAAVQGLNNLSLAALAQMEPAEVEQLVTKAVQLMGLVGLMAQSFRKK